MSRIHFTAWFFVFVLTWCGSKGVACAADPVDPAAARVGQQFTARDTLDCSAESSADARECLEGLRWKPTDFTVELEKSPNGECDFLVRFPSPAPMGDAVNDRVAMEWHVARDGDGKPITAPTMVVVHESGKNMAVGRMIARGLQTTGVHTFMIQLPGYGVRQPKKTIEADNILSALRQAIADVRRARDAVAVLPGVDTQHIGVQGTSLGGFVVATVAGLDHGYDKVFILLAGGNLHEVIAKGSRDSANLREKLAEAGIQGKKVEALTRAIEPMRLAHRIRPETTWIFSGANDDVVPPASSQALAEAAKLPAEHHVVLPVDHYNGILILPKILLEMKQALLE
jgi:dienelactone hydrolase